MTQGTSIFRSRSQLLTSYCPGTFFTFEGGTGAYHISSGNGPKADISEETRELIQRRIEEAAQSWLSRTRPLREEDPDKPVPPELCVDPELLDRDRNGIRDLGDRLAMLTPKVMYYEPKPLTMICSPCNLVRTYEGEGQGGLKKMHKELSILQGEKCAHPKGPSACGWNGEGSLPCMWRQLDILFVHWSGGAVGAMPHKYQWGHTRSEVYLWRYECMCGNRSAVLVRDTSRIGRWYFECASCGNTNQRWLQNDYYTLMQLREQTPDRMREIHMEPVSFRASSVTYPQTDRIIDFPGQNVTSLLRNRQQLLKKLAERFGYPRQELSMQELEEALSPYMSEERKNWEEYRENIRFIEDYKDKEGMALAIKAIREKVESIYEDWQKKGYIRPSYQIPEGILWSLDIREQAHSRFDPFRLFAEHLSLEEEIINGGATGSGKRKFVPFDSPDEDLVHAPFQGKRNEVLELFDRMGIARMGLIRRFELCFFSYGFTRRHPRPVFNNSHNVDVPVRLNLFDRVRVDERQKRPVYVLKQENEAIYVKLQEETVREYILDLQCSSRKSFQEGPFGSRVLENMQPMGMFLDNLREHRTGPDPYLAVYTLLHTMAHHVIHSVSEYSGLDLGSLGEYIFPADLAFVVYRNGMTMDLGNLSAMWRNQGKYFLRHLLQPKSLSCGLGMLCDNRGGACPDCIMIPEVTCIAQNKLLSRAILKGGLPPKEGGFNREISGYFSIAAKRREEKVAE